jgi:DNA-binding CsgD family transcriptional regulator
MLRTISGLGRNHLMVVPAAARATALCELLGLMGTGAVLVDAAGGIVGMSAAAEACLDQGLMIRNRRLAAEHPRTHRALTGLIDKALERDRAPTDETVIVERHTARPLIVRAFALDRRAQSLFHPARAMVVVVDAARVTLPTEQQLSSIFGLSRGEARLATRLAAGDNLATAAQNCGISYETARKRVKGAFAKTDTRRQAELVALLISIGSIAAGVDPVRRPRPASPLPIEPAIVDPHKQAKTASPTVWPSV